MAGKKQALKRGKSRFYFPEHPDHPLNGASFASASCYTGTYKGLHTRKVVEVWESNYRNNNYSDAYWEGTFPVTAKDFGADIVLVHHWSAELGSNRFYLKN